MVTCAGWGYYGGIELVKDRKTKERAEEEGRQVFLESLKRGLKTITLGHLTRFTPPLNIPQDMLEMAVDIFDEALTVVEAYFGYR